MRPRSIFKVYLFIIGQIIKKYKGVIKLFNRIKNRLIVTKKTIF